MNKGVIAYSLTVALLALPLTAWADANPDFDDDAKPILRTQPGLLHYVESRFEVKDTGTAKYPGDDDHRPGPPYIFHARPRGSDGPFTFLLLIQPGPPGHVLGVVDSRKMRINPPGQAPVAAPAQQAPPEVAQQPYYPPTYQSPNLSQGDVKPLPPENTSQTAPAPAPAPETPVQTPQPSEPTADTPSGPIIPNSSSGSSSQPNLAPPPDPAPSGQ